MKRVALPLFAALTLTLSSTVLLAAESPRGDGARHGGGRFETIDQNRDGALDRSEVVASNARWADRFDQIDRNRDGRVVPQELREARRLAEARRDLGKAKRAMQRAQFAYLDIDGDRALTQAEIGDKAPHLAEKFVLIDANHDGKLVAEELRAFRQAQREARGASRRGG